MWTHRHREFGQALEGTYQLCSAAFAHSLPPASIGAANGVADGRRGGRAARKVRLERGGGGRCWECGASSCLCLGEEMREELPCPALAPPLRVRACGEALLHLAVVHLSVGTSATCATSSSATRAGWAPSGSPPEGASCSRTRRPARRPRATVARRRAPRSSEGRGGRSGELRELEAGGGVLRCRRALAAFV